MASPSSESQQVAESVHSDVSSDFSTWMDPSGERGLGHLLSATWARVLEVSTPGLASHTAWSGLREAKPGWLWCSGKMCLVPGPHQPDLHAESCFSWTVLGRW